MLDVAYQTWLDVAALWLMGENIDKFCPPSPPLLPVPFIASADDVSDSLPVMSAA